MARRRFRRLTVLSAVAVLAGLGLYAFWYEPSGIKVAEHVIELGAASRISPQPLRVAVISDLHAGAPYIGEAKIDQVVALTNGARPDLILLTGDYVTMGVIGGAPMPIEAIADRLSGLSAPLGVYAVLGNHDRVGDARTIVAMLEQRGIPVLENKMVTLEGRGELLYLAGFSYLFDRIQVGPPSLTNLPADARALCFTHSPDIFLVLPDGCALTIAGHTHGGQVALPLIGRPIVPSGFGQRYAAGLIRENGKTFFVSTGIGTSFVPVRFGVPPEVSILEIR